MFDFLDGMTFGRDVKANGKTWSKLKGLQNGYLLAVEKGTPLPAPVFVILDPDHKKMIDEMEKEKEGKENSP